MSGEEGYKEIVISLGSDENLAGTNQSSAQAPPVPPRIKERRRVQFNNHSEVNDVTNQRSALPTKDRYERDSSLSPITSTFGPSPAHSRDNSGSALLTTTPEQEKENPFADPPTLFSLTQSPVTRPRPSVLRNNSYNRSIKASETIPEDDGDSGEYNEKAFSALAAQERAQRIASLVGSHSAPASRRNSAESEVDGNYVPAGTTPSQRIRIDDIPLISMNGKFDQAVDSDEEDDHTKERHRATATSEAHKLVRAHTRKGPSDSLGMTINNGTASGAVTPNGDSDIDKYVPRPAQYRGSVLSSLLKLYNAPQPQHARVRSSSSSSFGGSPAATLTPGSSGMTTPSRPKPTKWYNHKAATRSQDTLAGLIEASSILGAPGAPSSGGKAAVKPPRPGMGKRTRSTETIKNTIGRMGGRPRLEDEIRITVHIAETLSRQKYLLKLCRALMAYGAPTHRLEEYMKMSARVLEIDGQFLYMPGCMIISFDDAATHTTEVKMVRAIQGVDLGKLKDVHEIYKEVVHDVIGVEEATQRLDAVIRKKQKHHKWFLVACYGLASAIVGPFAFESRLIDMPIAFILGSLVGYLQLIIAPQSELYNNVFEISAAVLTSFLARAFGSLQGGNLFCFSALAQSSIVLILPGYVVLCGSLELQSRSIVAGSVRMVYAIIYSLFLGFGITIGTAMYGLIDSGATSATTCTNPLPPHYRFFFVPLFTMLLCIINGAKWKQTPVMLVISFAGYIANFFAAKKFPTNTEISGTLGALAIGVLGNLYSRLRHGLAAAAILPAIFVQVPSGLAASGSLLAGLSSADEITNGTTTAINGTSTVSGLPDIVSGSGSGSSSSSSSSPHADSAYNPMPGTGLQGHKPRSHFFSLPWAIASWELTNPGDVKVTSTEDLNTIVFNVGYSMIQVAIGITVGLFLSALIVYPLGKRRSGLFSF